MTKVGGIRKIMFLWQAVFLAASPLVTAPPSNLTRLYYNGSAAKSHSTATQYRQLRRLELRQQFRFPNEILCRSKNFICNIVLIKLCINFAVNYFLELFWNGNARYL